jgi:hypothetical protein
VLCLTPNAHVLSGTGMLLGDPVMIANEVVYDVENQRMG